MEQSVSDLNATCVFEPRSSFNPVTRLCDATLVELAKAGDEQAYVELYTRHSPMAARVIQRMMHNAEDTEDILQDACIRAFVHLQSFDGRSAFSTWLTRIAVNCALMMLRKRRCRPEAMVHANAVEDIREIQFVDLSPGPEKEYAHVEASRQLKRAIRQLSPVLQTAVTLRYGNGLRIKEVAQTIGISVPAVKSRLSRATSELRVLMNERSA
jgi:RNA polymerase sigma-70 factor (ECF subfamily)